MDIELSSLFTAIAPYILPTLLSGGLLKVWLDGRAAAKTAAAAEKQSKASASKTDMDRACELIEKLQLDNDRLRTQLARQDAALHEMRDSYEQQMAEMRANYEKRIDDLEAEIELLKQDNLKLRDSVAAYQSAQKAGRRGT